MATRSTRKRAHDAELLELIAHFRAVTGDDAFNGITSGEQALRRLREGYVPLVIARHASKALGVAVACLDVGTSRGAAASNDARGSEDRLGR